MIPSLIKNTVNTPNAAYKRMATRWELINALMGGTEAMRDAGQTFLPKNEGEADLSYDRRLNKTFLYEGFNSTVGTLVGKPFSEDIQLHKDITGAMREYMDNVDLMGNDITTFASQVAETGVAKGIAHVLVDYAALKGQRITLAEKAQLGVRPYLVNVDPENVIGWQYTLEKGVPVLSQVRIRECFMEQDGEWGEKCMTRVRVFDRLSGDGVNIVTFRVFEERKMPQTGETVWPVVDYGPCSTQYIPLNTIYFGKRVGFMEARPPLMGLAWLNVEHWQSSSEQRNILNVARCPLWFLSGYQPDLDDEGNPKDDIKVGPDSMIRMSAADADLKIVEHTGAAIGSGRTDLQDIEARMAHLGTEMLFKGSSGDTTATEAGHDNVAEDCKLGSMIKAEEDGLTSAVCMMYEYEHVTAPKGKLITINTDFGLEPQDAADLQVLYQSRMSGLITHATYLKELKRRGVLAADTNTQMETDAAKTEGPVAVAGKDNTPNAMGAGGASSKAGAGA